MAGHSKWANIQHRKGAQDKKRGKLFTKLAKEITVATRMGGPDPDSNPRLRLAIDKAKGQSLPKDNIERAIKRGSGAMEGDDYEEIRYEGYGPNGVAVMVDCLSDNRNRTVSDVRHAFTKHGGNLGSDGSVAYLFNRSGVIVFSEGDEALEEQVMDIALEAGAEDITTNEDGSIEVLTPPDAYETVRDALKAAGLEPAHSDITMLATTSVALDSEQAETLTRLIDALDDLDDVQDVYSNAEYPDTEAA
ncbi:YebC/PmpR family DNA-binding transcriptional regulator [Abyssibacter profundi]|uniref:Probable transcriptional regulatory protein DEH80_02920 n=1 Tax=Abyssibacter profundi TaxID=2182787 RepID=A0A363UPX6_9GAMM|nr:YebC/PmpR family DNA-binding transcriptional regulator [Abyssibacter profundi]MBV62605.1 YebC/PmpR family DNA-binding transcriptional regulator [Nevskiales bacterium]PWN57457.1 YebC/PmpR family DNA-binding transcriptional regulator [Abyssibacter profundi]